ncbi:MAG: hypothetical protein ACRDPR_21700 [Nocardioidaceae bacterium]
MGRVISLQDWRERHDRVVVVDAFGRLEDAVRRLDPAVAQVAAPDGTVDPRIETELLAITGAVSMGMADEAIQRAERLADMLEHPTARRR